MSLIHRLISSTGLVPSPPRAPSPYRSFPGLCLTQFPLLDLMLMCPLMGWCPSLAWPMPIPREMSNVLCWGCPCLPTTCPAPCLQQWDRQLATVSSLYTNLCSMRDKKEEQEAHGDLQRYSFAGIVGIWQLISLVCWGQFFDTDSDECTGGVTANDSLDCSDYEPE